MDPKHLIPLILILLPGYVAFEIANGLGWKRSRRTEKLRFFSVATMGGAVFVLLSILMRWDWLRVRTFPKWNKAIGDPVALWEALTRPEVTLLAIGLLMVATVLAGLLWAAWRDKGLPRLIKIVNEKQQVPYHGETYVWEKLVEKIDEGHWVTIHTQSRKVIQGSVEVAPDFGDDRDLVVRAEYVGYDTDNRFEPQLEELAEDFDRLIFIPKEEISLVQLYVDKLPEPEKPVDGDAPQPVPEPEPEPEPPAT